MKFFVISIIFFTTFVLWPWIAIAEEYPVNVQNEIMMSCIKEGVSESNCKCFLSKLETTTSLNDLSSLKPKKIQRIANFCHITIKPKAHTGRRKDSANNRTIPSYVHVSIVGVLIAPYKSASRTPWDGSGGGVNQFLVDAVGVMIKEGGKKLTTANPIGRLAVIAASKIYDSQKDNILRLASTLGKPDVKGYISYAGYTQSLNKIQDSFEPSWGPIGFDVKYNDDLRISLFLEDSDLSMDDPIGMVEINSDDIQAAWDHKQILAIYTADQDEDILYVKISVTPISR